jgi:hypothetical protein
MGIFKWMQAKLFILPQLEGINIRLHSVRHGASLSYVKREVRVLLQLLTPLIVE